MSTAPERCCLVAAMFAICLSPVQQVLALASPDVERAAASEVRGAFLAQGVGARAVGMGEAFVAVADDASAAAWNPAGLGRLGSMSAIAMHEIFTEGMGLSYAAVAIPVGPGALGFGLRIFSFGSFEQRDAAGGSLGTASPVDIAGQVAWGMRNAAWVGGNGWSGAAIEVVREDGLPGILPAVSAGIIVPVGSSLSLGAAAYHLGPRQDGFALPASIAVGGSYAFSRRARVALDAGRGLVDEESRLSLGGECPLSRAVTVRAGYRWTSSTATLGGIAGLTAGIGAKFTILELDYALQPFGNVVTAHRFSVVYRRAPSGSQTSPH